MVDLWDQVMTIRGQILLSSTDDDPLPSVCGFKTSPCVRSKLPRVYVQNFPVCTGTTRTCFNTCARGAGIHGDVLNVHTVTFLNPHTGFSTFFQGAATHTHTHTKHTPHTHQTTPRPPNNTTTTTTQHTTSHEEREKERERQRETRERETRQDKRRRYNKKTREDEGGETRQEEERR